MFRKCLICLALSAFVYPAGAYYIAWEGDCLPEDAGWERTWGDWSGQYHGTGAVRTLADGVMTMDSLYDPGIADFAEMPGSFNPVPGELLVMEWRLAVDQVVGTCDPAVGLSSDDGWAVGFHYTADHVEGAFDDALYAAVTPGEFHDYRVTSWDMRSYDLFIDGELRHAGIFRYVAGYPHMAWGDGAQGAASLHRWDYVRICTIPEPPCLALCGAVGCWSLCIRRISWVQPALRGVED
jgi:hypothetical protein